ncbi:MAG: hypothetical protein II939_09590 [Bacteroidales bacterium]|nr:hypothetical protein [Bacteroidales bacterium]
MQCRCSPSPRNPAPLHTSIRCAKARIFYFCGALLLAPLGASALSALYAVASHYGFAYVPAPEAQRTAPPPRLHIPAHPTPNYKKHGRNYLAVQFKRCGVAALCLARNSRAKDGKTAHCHAFCFVLNKALYFRRVCFCSAPLCTL